MPRFGESLTCRECTRRLPGGEVCEAREPELITCWNSEAGGIREYIEGSLASEARAERGYIYT